MKVYLSVDMEGISGISGSEFVHSDRRLYPEARRYYTAEINACARACFDAGATEVIALDGHGGGNHALWDQLDGRLELVQGTGRFELFPGLAGADAFILLGYHAMAGTAGALLEHSFSSASIQNLWLNGRPVGEIGIHAAMAAELGVPTVLVTGDDYACAEAQAWIPGVVTCAVKQGLGCQSARMLSQEAAHHRIAACVMQALAMRAEIPPAAVAPPVTLRKEVKERIAIPHPGTIPGLTVLDGRTYEITAESVTEALRLSR